MRFNGDLYLNPQERDSDANGRQPHRSSTKRSAQGNDPLETKPRELGRSSKQEFHSPRPVRPHCGLTNAIDDIGSSTVASLARNQWYASAIPSRSAIDGRHPRARTFSALMSFRGVP